MFTRPLPFGSGILFSPSENTAQVEVAPCLRWTRSNLACS